MDLVQEGIDLAIRIGRLPISGLIARSIGRCRMVVCAAPAYIKRHGRPDTPDKLRTHRRLGFSETVSPGDWTLLDKRGRAHVIGGNCQLLANNMQLLLAAALEGAGIAYGPSFVFGESLQNGSGQSAQPASSMTRAITKRVPRALHIKAVYPS